MEVQPGKKRPRSPEGGLQQSKDNNGNEHHHEDVNVHVGVSAQALDPPPHPLLIPPPTSSPPPAPHINNKATNSGNGSQKSKQFSVEWHQQSSARGGDRGGGHAQSLAATAVVTMASANTCLSIAGRCSLHVRTGSVEILGYTIHAADADAANESDANDDQVEEYHLESPSWTAWSTVLSLEPDTILVLTSSSSTKNDDAAVEGPAVGPAQRPEPVVPTFQIHGVQSVETSASTSVRQVQVQPTLIPTSWKLATDLIVQDLNATESAEESQPRHALFRDTLEEDDELPDGNDDNKSNISKSKNHGFRIVVAGAKGVGKSTCVRYLVNRL
jgi:hypothetical protein